MKKFIILLMSAILLFSVFAITACGKEEESKTPTSKTTSSGEEETSSAEKLSRVFGDSSTGNSNNNPGIVSIPQDNSNAPTSVTVPSFSGDSYYVTPVPIPSGVSDDVRKLIIQINAIDSVTPSNYTAIEPTIASAESRYALLSPTEQAQVANYNHLVAAREAFNKIVAQAEINAFLDKYSQFEIISTPSKQDVPLVAELKAILENFNQDQIAKIADFATKKSKVNSAYESLKSQGFMQFTFIADDQTVSSSTFFIFSNSNPETGSTGQDKFTVDGKYLSNTVRFDFGETITFNTSISGNLKIYCSNNDRTVTCTHDDGTSIVESKVMLPDADDNNYREFNLSKAGNYTLTLNEGEIFIYAIILTA